MKYIRAQQYLLLYDEQKFRSTLQAINYSRHYKIKLNLEKTGLDLRKGQAIYRIQVFCHDFVNSIEHLWFWNLNKLVPTNNKSTYLIIDQLMSNLEQINISTADQLLQTQFKNSRSLRQSVISRFQNSPYSDINLAGNLQIFTFEFMAIFLFIYGNSCKILSNEMDAQAAGCLLMAIFFSGPLCGANINPVITISNFLKRQNKYKAQKLILYIIAQFLGASAAIGSSYLLGHKQVDPLAIGDGLNIFRIFTNEAIGVFILVLFSLLLSNPNTTFIQSQLSGYFSISVFYYIAQSLAPLAGFIINPAFTVVLAAQYGLQGNLDFLAHVWIWLGADLLGCIAGTLFYDRMYQPIVSQLRQIRRKSSINDNSMSKSLLHS